MREGVNIYLGATSYLLKVGGISELSRMDTENGGDKIRQDTKLTPSSSHALACEALSLSLSAL